MKESELCELFIKDAEQFGFRSFGEYEDWDIVLARHNIIVGVQAKVNMNVKAITQTIKARGVDFKVIITDNYQFKIGDDWSIVTNALRILHLTHFDSGFHLVNNVNTYNLYWLRKFRMKPKTKLKIPNFDYYTPSGVPGPRKVTERNISIVRLEVMALQRGFVTLADARALGLERVPRYYFDYEWMKRIWTLKPSPFRPSDDYPHIAKGLLGQ